MLGPARTISPAGSDATRPEVVTDADGDSVIIWLRGNGAGAVFGEVVGRRLAADGTLGPATTLSGPGSFLGFFSGTHLDIAPDGAAAVTWVGGDDVIHARLWPESGTPGAIVDLSGGQQDAGWPEVGVDDDGNAVVVWNTVPDFGTDCCSLVETARLATDGSHSSPQRLSALHTNGDASQVAVDAAGNAIFSWIQRVGCCDRVESTRWSAGGFPDLARPQSEPGLNALFSDVGIAADGDAVLGWTLSDQGNLLVQARAISAAARPRATQTISNVNTDSGLTQVGVDSDGDGTFNWLRNGGRALVARERAGAGGLFPRATVSASPTGGIHLPRLEVNDADSAAASWTTSEGSMLTGDIEAAFRP